MRVLFISFDSRSSFPHAVTQQHEALQVRKNPWTKKQMFDASYLDQAAEWSKSLTRMRARGPGDIENAMRSIERDYGIDYWLLWRLRYRKSVLKDISVTPYMRLGAAYRAEQERLYRNLHNDLKRTEEATGPDNAVVVAVKALVGEGEE